MPFSLGLDIHLNLDPPAAEEVDCYEEDTEVVVQDDEGNVAAYEAEEVVVEDEEGNVAVYEHQELVEEDAEGNIVVYEQDTVTVGVRGQEEDEEEAEEEEEEDDECD